MKILVIGDSCQDIFIYGRCDRLSPEAPVPVFTPIKTVKNGGMSLNVFENLKSIGVDVNIITNSDKITKTRYVDVTSNQQIIRVDSEKNNCDRIKNIDEIEFDKFDIIIISDYNKGFLHKEDIKFVCEKHKNVFIDTKKLIDENFESCRFIKINKKEYEYNIEHSNYILTIPDKLIVTQGGDGTKFKNETFSVKNVEVKDSVGAGDTFIAVFSYEYMRSGDVENSIRLANKCSSIIVQHKGVNKIGDFIKI
jgi:bifunctional ADP-heptose synthase (sugar kinase/adenylyltransferase)